jgi:lipopolysaccharide biosynthesis protein
MRSRCFYSSYFSGTDIPYYVQFYLIELSKHFDEIVFITPSVLSTASSDFLSRYQFIYFQVENEGYDFGMWHKAIEKYGVDELSYIGLVNDSCILFTTLDHVFERFYQSNESYCGMVISDRIATHIQSYFLLIRGEGISLARKYFSEHRIVRDYRMVIRVYEIGLSQAMINQGLKIKGFYNESHRGWPKNPSFSRISDLIDEGIPMIKKKIMFRNYRGLEWYWVVRMNFNTNYRTYIRQIEKKYGSLNIIDFKRVMIDAPRQGNADIVFLEIARRVASFASSIPPVRWIFYAILNRLKKLRKA